MIIFKIINLALEDVDHHQDQITNMNNLRRERERERKRSIQKYQQQCFCNVNIYIFLWRYRERKQLNRNIHVMYKGPLIKLCYRANFRNNVIEHYPWSWDSKILFPGPSLGSCLSQLFH